MGVPFLQPWAKYINLITILELLMKFDLRHEDLHDPYRER